MDGRSGSGLKAPPFWRGWGRGILCLVQAGLFERIGRAEGVLGKMEGVFLRLAAGQQDQKNLPSLVLAGLGAVQHEVQARGRAADKQSAWRA